MKLNHVKIIRTASSRSYPLASVTTEDDLKTRSTVSMTLAVSDGPGEGGDGQALLSSSMGRTPLEILETAFIVIASLKLRVVKMLESLPLPALLSFSKEMEVRELRACLRVL